MAITPQTNTTLSITSRDFAPLFQLLSSIMDFFLQEDRRAQNLWRYRQKVTFVKKRKSPENKSDEF